MTITSVDSMYKVTLFLKDHKGDYTIEHLINNLDYLKGIINTLDRTKVEVNKILAYYLEDNN